MLEMSFGMSDEADAVWTAMKKVFETGFTTADLSASRDDIQLVSTVEFGDKVVQHLDKLLG